MAGKFDISQIVGLIIALILPPDSCFDCFLGLSISTGFPNSMPSTQSVLVDLGVAGIASTLVTPIVTIIDR